MPEQPGEEADNKNHVPGSFVPVIKHLLEQAESKCTADKENITMHKTLTASDTSFSGNRTEVGADMFQQKSSVLPSLWRKKKKKLKNG